ncbi:DnaJ domain protein [Oesophagostomum dentatum]|uniref:DnaJ domain protein n=1 Tax=Oesophagostomum dentatum TaxID=61180 RepID=A0A0B1TT13_OESDE|nr:DnaJ domain protein [Oesophagostomum dentatum]
MFRNMSVGDSLSLAVAVYGFLPRTKRIEQAGHAYECSLIRDKITLGKCTLPVLRRNSQTEDRESTPEEDGEVQLRLLELFLSYVLRCAYEMYAYICIDDQDRSAWYDADDEKYEKYLMKLDPNDTKNQDHYKVLGLSKLRFKATMAEIRSCYRAKVLKYHPDKKKHRGETLPGGEDYFTCITKAYEQLGVSEAKRQAYDSVDHKFNDAIPSEKSINKDNFFNELSPVFERNARWSTRKPVPRLGNIDSDRKAVEDFYNFWFDFSSWREFSYLDEEDKEKGEDRYERRELEKINKAERERRRKEEAKRIRRLVELAYSKDPRIAKFKREDQEMKNKVKEEKQRRQREKAEAAERERRAKEEAEMKAKEEQERLAREEKEKERKEKEAAKKAAAAQRRRFKKLAESAGHWTDDARTKLEEMERVERLCLSLPVDAMSDLCDSIEKLSVREEILAVIAEAEATRIKAAKAETKAGDKPKDAEKSAVLWTSDEIQLLIKASNTYPAGTVDRWNVIADYINEHRKDKSTPPKNEKQVIKQCKAVQSMNVKLPVTTQNTLGASLPDEDTWTVAEQKLLEQAIKTYPSSDPERWDKISTLVGTKTKKACIRRFKYLVQLVKNKKEEAS